MNDTHILHRLIVRGARHLGPAALLVAAFGISAMLTIRDGAALLGQATNARTSLLGPCEADETLFPRLRVSGKTTVETWADRYHQNVREIIDAHLPQLRDGACGEDLRTPPSEPLERLAEDMVGWRSKGDLSEEDMPAVLIDYEHAFECALEQESFALSDAGDLTTFLQQDEQVANQSIPAAAFLVIGDSERIFLDQQIALARTSLRRVLTLLTGRDRLRTIDRSLQCMERATLDIRNALSLAADASACLPRIWDARTSLRTPAELPQ